MTGRALGHAWPQLAKTGLRLIADGHMMPICVARYLVSNSVLICAALDSAITMHTAHMHACVVSPSWVA
jgi:hypothetical protein